MRSSKLAALSAAALLTASLAACSSTPAEGQDAPEGDWETITIEHALGTAVIDEKPERVATVN